MATDRRSGRRVDGSLSLDPRPGGCQWPGRSPRWWPGRVPTPGDDSRRWRWPTSSRSRLLHAERVARGDDDDAVMEQPVEEGDRGRVLGQEAAPVLERPVAGGAEAAPRVGHRDEPEQQLAADIVERGEAQVVADHVVGPQDMLDDLPHRVVGQAAIERLDEGHRGEVADAQPRVDGRLAEGDQGVALAGPGRAHEDDVLAGPDPLEPGEVAERRLPDRALGDLELVERLGDREPGRPTPGGLVGGIAGGDLRLDERAQELLGRPALALRAAQD